MGLKACEKLNNFIVRAPKARGKAALAKPWVGEEQEAQSCQGQATEGHMGINRSSGNLNGRNNFKLYDRINKPHIYKDKLKPRKPFIYIFIIFVIICAVLFAVKMDNRVAIGNLQQTFYPRDPMLLLGEKHWNYGVSSYVFGVNNTNLWNTNNNIETNTKVQQLVKEAHFPLMRIWFFSPYNDYSALANNAETERRLKLVSDMGAQCLGVLADTSPRAFDYYKHIVQLAGNRCNMYEFGNEPGEHRAPDMPAYLQAWNTLIPQLRRINPNALFIGPAAGEGPIVTPHWIPDFLKGVKASGVLPDAVSFHEYSTDPSLFGAEVTRTRQLIKSILRKDLPVGITEWNEYCCNDSGWTSAPGYSQYVTDALKSMIAAHTDFANEFTLYNHGGSGDSNLDMFDPSGQPRPEYDVMKSMIAEYSSGVSSSSYPALTGSTITPTNDMNATDSLSRSPSFETPAPLAHPGPRYG
jgi:hypothetical protein